jgi:simple sugar transport system permease protein
VAGLGLNFGIVIGAMAAQISMFLVVLWGGQGILGVAYVALLATPIAIILGYLIGKLFNKMKGSEMIGGMVTALFADGFYQFLFLFVMGGIITINNEQLMIGTGVGVVNAIDLDRDNNMRHALDNVSLLNILTVAVWIVLAFVIALIIFNLFKKQPLKLRGRGGLLKPLIVLALLWLAYGLSFVIEPFLSFLYYDRVIGLIAVRLAALFTALYAIYRIIRVKVLGEKRAGALSKPISHIVLAAAIFVVTLFPAISNGLSRVRLPVFTYLIIFGLCLFINWFLTTRLGQNMRTAGHDRAVATAAGINVDRTRVIAMILSTLLAAYAQIIMLQNFGVLQTYGAHSQVGLYAIAALLVGGATVSRASVKHAILGVILFHSLFILAPMAGNRLMGSALIGEYFRVFVANAVIAIALIMHAWKLIKSKKKGKPELKTKVAAV